MTWLGWRGRESFDEGLCDAAAQSMVEIPWDSVQTNASWLKISEISCVREEERQRERESKYKIDDRMTNRTSTSNPCVNHPKRNVRDPNRPKRQLTVRPLSEGGRNDSTSHRLRTWDETKTSPTPETFNRKSQRRRVTNENVARSAGGSPADYFGNWPKCEKENQIVC